MKSIILGLFGYRRSFNGLYIRENRNVRHAWDIRRGLFGREVYVEGMTKPEALVWAEEWV